MSDFIVGKYYARADVLSAVQVIDPGGGNWYTGLVQHDDEFFVFCNVGVGGRTGHDYLNHFDGADLEWTGKTGSRVGQAAVTRLVEPERRVHVFYRDDNRQPFVYAGLGRAAVVRDVTPLQVRWSFARDAGVHPELLANEISTDDAVFEGARHAMVVNVYERDPSARARCLRKWGFACSVCELDFAAAYGKLGVNFIHVHHLTPLAEIGTEYLLDPERDLRPVCPNCHAMIHRQRPPLSIEEVRAAYRDELHSANRAVRERPR